jgi:hypothetical protein
MESVRIYAELFQVLYLSHSYLKIQFYKTENTVHLQYKDQLFKSVWEHNNFLFCKLHETNKNLLCAQKTKTLLFKIKQYIQ